ncbi:acyl carrier protein [Spongiactinospora rosea]|uniref:Acyl carrier protein n=1 Tax=Spongiactinospora rosea TaxID=2248750 RepID=A0A366LP55_9ACTN|nr:acyl carrier protein [Spongiactinospora rosea]RBQ15293.1 acyl carrier protein [Spongiactinospora rosea]
MSSNQETAEIEQAIRSILIRDLFVEVPDIGLDDGLRSVAGLDSLGYVELRVQCEDRFGISITEKDFTPENFATIRSISRLVGELRARAGADRAQ